MFYPNTSHLVLGLLTCSNTAKVEGDISGVDVAQKETVA
ncbi:hypothetical protein BN938_0660 [Mucinivorans hirudinis]|uniref:Uncharacterized protein n=1 Tax=Mucinivorans hirudinis TaxID=1433126 RepID=A0A060R6S3_9BACT|nr:hypothetical protein BN938_0660 [Mucinivorans hirudinis]